MQLARRGALAGVVIAAAACTTFAGSNDAPPGDAGADAAADDASATSVDAPADDAAAADAGGDAAPNLLFNGDFEMGCTGWFTSYATVSDSPTAHTGTKACRVCGTNGGITVEMFQDVMLPLEAGARYVVEAWIRTPDADAATSSALDALIILGSRESDGPGTTLQDSWQRVSVSAVVGDTGLTKATAGLAAPASNAGCWLVDDARLYPVP